MVATEKLGGYANTVLPLIGALQTIPRGVAHNRAIPPQRQLKENCKGQNISHFWDIVIPIFIMPFWQHVLVHACKCTH